MPVPRLACLLESPLTYRVSCPDDPVHSNGSEFVPGVHTAAVRDDGTLAGVHSLEGIEGGGDNGSAARVEWSLRPAE